MVSAFYLKQLDTNNRENEQEQYSDDEDVENVFQGVHHALEHSLQKHKISVRWQSLDTPLEIACDTKKPV